MKKYLAPLLAICIFCTQNSFAAFSVSDIVLPILRVGAVYPEEARDAEIEGFCTVQFSIRETGSVENYEIVKCEPEGYFEDSVKKAISRFKYNPNIVDGVGFSLVGMIEVFWFSSPSDSKYSHSKSLGVHNKVDDCLVSKKECTAHLATP